ncbi:TIGR01459 family HAD-type hydrolase [Azospirillum picis]|uniref:HAD superfamily hydrolase (TIGR01459 family) n=1 Tax=Azospirillum picis TaxID=488438 RepID=A0ABU0MSC4_9PROT|nr:TIGR01459 family HAD-type hydrolase [Azospirillum picis]MBP2301944.1 HAD superfamily hydrolase (TIGR01459 family) [Azospirillum picis]MDQ0536393.1 HAD superfamily hydrolase (TIGR01459 family) [Azospirillum picis]
MADIRQISGIAEVIDRYDGFILDLWGVLHDGEQLYPGVADCVDRMRDAGKTLCLLSNAPRRTPGAVEKLAGMGMGRERYHHVMTSGEATYEALRDRNDPWHAALGRRLLHIGPARDTDIYDGLGYEVVERPEEADFVVNTGIVTFGETLEDYQPQLDACRAANLPMVCANPDLVVMVGPMMVICAGTLAARYEQMGGDVRQHGKPHAPVYQRCFELLGIADKSRILAVGDSLRTDVAGANAAGIDVALVTAGIHQEELGGAAWGEAVNPVNLRALADATGHMPTYATPSLRW